MLDIKSAGSGKYIVNDTVLVYNIDAGIEGITYDVNYDTSVSKVEAENLAKQFIHETVTGIENKD